METWHYEPASDLDQPMIERLRRFPREPDMLVYTLRSLAALMVRGWLKLYHRLEITGSEHLPATGSFVMVANHASHLDALCLLSALPLRKLHRAFPVAARDYFFVTAPRVAAAAILVNALPFERQVHARQSLELCRTRSPTTAISWSCFPKAPAVSTARSANSVPVLAGCWQAHRCPCSRAGWMDVTRLCRKACAGHDPVGCG